MNITNGTVSYLPDCSVNCQLWSTPVSVMSETKDFMAAVEMFLKG